MMINDKSGYHQCEKVIKADIKHKLSIATLTTVRKPPKKVKSVLVKRAYKVKATVIKAVLAAALIVDCME